MIERDRLIRPAGGVRLEPKGPGFPARTTVTARSPRLLLADPAAIEGAFTDRVPGQVGHFVRYVGLALADFGGPREGPVWWKEPYLVWAVSGHRAAGPGDPSPGWGVLAPRVRSESGVLAVVPLHNPMRNVVAAARRVCQAGLGCDLRLPAGRWSAYYQQHDPPAGGDPAAARDVVLRHVGVRPRPVPPEGPWCVVIGLARVRTRDQFFEVVGRRLSLPRRRPEPRFWGSLGEVLTSRPGPVILRMTGWADFERRQSRLAYRWREAVQSLRTSGETRGLTVEYDAPPAGPPVPTRRLQVLLARGSDLTLPALAARLRAGRPKRTVEETGGRLDISAGGWRMHVGYLTDRDRLAAVRDWSFVDQFVELPPEADVSEVAAAPKVLDVWTTGSSPRSRTHSRVWDAVVTTICTDFRNAYRTEEEFEPLT